jgi:hypothetical protein
MDFKTQLLLLMLHDSNETTRTDGDVANAALISAETSARTCRWSSKHSYCY